MRFGSVCSGIEAASVAWEPLGWQAAWVSEIEAFPSAVLAHHWPDVSNLGDMLALPERVASGEIEAPDVLVGGTPCQAFSVAGLRKSLDDARGNLSLTYVELADAIDRKRDEHGEQPCVIVWENVPGVLSTKDNAFGCFLAGLAGEDEPLLPPGKRWTNAGLVLGPKRAVAWRILDAQYFGVAQRRRRVFVVASARDGFDPSQILFEFDGVRRDTPPRREKGEGIAGDAGAGATRGSHWDAMTNPHPSLNQSHNTGGIGASNQELFSQRGSGIVWPAEIASTLNAAFGSKMGLEDQHVNSGCLLFVPAVSVTGDIAHTLKGEGFDGSEGGTGRGVPTIAAHVFDPNQITSKTNRSTPKPDICHTLPATSNSPVAFGIPAQTVALRGRDGGATAELGGEVATALRASTGGGDKPHVLASAMAFAQNTRDEVRLLGGDGEISGALAAQPGMKQTTYVAPQMAVRRLTPVECERLQGFTPRAEAYRVSVCWEDRSLEPAAVETPCTTVQNSVLRVEGVERLDNALSAGPLLMNAPQNLESLAGVHVLIDCAAKKAVLLSAGKLIWSASVADEQSACLLHTLPESSALRLAQMLRSAAKTTQAGKAELPQNETACTVQESGRTCADRFGETLKGAALAVERDTKNQTRFTTCITSILGQKPQKSGLSETTLFSSAIHAIASYTHEITPLASSFTLEVAVVLPHTLVPYRNKPAADGPRYKALGNSMAVPVMAWIGSRVQHYLKGDL